MILFSSHSTFSGADDPQDFLKSSYRRPSFSNSLIPMVRDVQHVIIIFARRCDYLYLLTKMPTLIPQIITNFEFNKQ